MIFIMSKDDEVLATLNNESPDSCPYWNDKHVETINDSLSTYEFEAPLEHRSSEFLVGANYIARSDMDGYFMLFKITNVVEAFSNGTRTKRVFCENAAISELNGHIIRPKVMDGYTAEDAIEYMVMGSAWERGQVDFLGAKDFKLDSYETAIAGIHMVANAFEGELRYRLSRNRASGTVRRFIDLLDRRGEDTGKRFEYMKDINGLTRTEDTTYLATALIGIGKADTDGNRMTFASVNYDQDWIGDDDALDRYGSQGRHIFGVYEDNDAENPVALREATKKELAKRSKPIFTYDVDVLLLETLADWSHEEVRLGDTVRVLDMSFTPEVVLSARVISLERSYVDPTQDRAILGEYKALTYSIPAAVKQMQKQLVSNEGILKGREKTISIGPLPPTDKERKWMDTSTAPNILRRWDSEINDWVAAGGEQGPEGPAGPTMYTWIKYANDSQGNGLSDDPANKSYIGIAYNKTTSTESTNPTLYTWTLLKGTDGEQGIPGPAGTDGRTPYVHIAYANNAAGTLDFSTTIATNKAFMGTYTDYLENDSLDPTDYTWAQIKGETGQQGPQGVSNYIYIRYSANADGNPMTANPDSNSRFMGVVTTTSLTAPPAYSDYTWSRYQGPQGVQGLQGLQGDQGDQGVQGPPGSSSYTHIAYATGSAGQNFSTSHFTTATYIGIYVDNVAQDSTDYTKYKWTLIKGADGTQGLPGPAGADGKTPYFHTAWATNATGTTGFSTTVSIGKTYIGTYTDFVQADSTDPSKYNWVLIKGEQGIQGIQGIQGPAGPNGETMYTWIKYADTPTTGMTDLPAGKTYIGIAYNKLTPTESNVYSDYTWSLIKGEQGAPGPAGPEGESLYTWIKYADTPTTGMSDSPASKKYMGIAYNKTVQTESTTYSDYEWSLIEGPQGPTGPQGPQGPVGTSISSVDEYYLATSASTGVTTATAGWTTTMQTMTTTNRYLWNYEKINFSDGSSQTTIPVAIGVYGNTGATGRSITAITERYLTTAIGSGITRATSGWSTTPQVTTPTNKYLWNYEEITWSSAPLTTYVEPYIIGIHGEQGPPGPQGTQGIQGPAGADGQSLYTWVKYADTDTGTGMSDLPVGKKYIGLAYNKTSPTESSTAGDYTWSKVEGDQGAVGPVGPNGQSLYTWVKYADSPTSGISDSPVGKKYMGIAYNKSTQTESATYSDYEWSLIQGDIGPQGPVGTSVSSITEYYLATASSSGVTTATAGWTTTMQTMDTTKKYLWNYEKINFSDSTSQDTTPVIVGVHGGTGATGATGRSITAITERYLATNASSGVTRATAGWTTTTQVTTPTNKYLWNYEEITWSSAPLTTYVEPIIIGIHGEQGPQGAPGPQGTQGIQGPAGTDGQSLYTWVKYADTDTGTGMSDLPAGKKYIGLAYNKTTPTESTNAGDYSWSKVEGDQGLVGPTGPNGQSLYTWIKYADSPTTGMNDSPSGKKYMGVAYNKTTQTESTTYSDYEWSLIQGDIGPQGPTGTSVSSITEYYLATASSSGVTTATAGWTTTVQTMDTTKRYLWNYERITFSNGTTQDTTPVITGVHGATGATGGTGRSITAITERYLATNLSTEVTRATSGWTTTMQVTTPTNKYLWNYEEITWSSAPTTTYVEPIIIGIHGEQGPQGAQGIQGPPGTNGTSQYVHIRYSSASNGNPMTTAPDANTQYIGIANTTSATAPTGYASYTWSLFKGPTGSPGVPGTNGTNGVTTYTWVKYADSETGAGISDTPSGKRYIGLAFNKTTPTESNTSSDYTWSPLYDNVKVGGRNLIGNTKDLTGYLYRTDDSYNGFNIARSVRGATGYINTFSASSILPPEGTTHVLSFYAKASAETNIVCHWYSPNTTTSAVSSTGQSSTSTDGNIQVSITTSWQRYWVVWTQTATTSVKSLIVGRHSIAPEGTVLEIAGVQLEAGNVPTDWTPAPEDLEAKVDDKVNKGDLDSLAEMVTTISSKLNLKAGAGEFDAMKLAYNARVEQDILDKKQLAIDLATIEGRAILAETIAGESKLVTSFIETVITESEEGIFISNKGSSTGILISNDRISFMDGTTEVAYISNQTMQINHGIFVESATIAKYKFELIPGTEILAIQWVGG